jgi:hypothetical protein
VTLSCSHCCSRKTIVFLVPKMCVCSLRYSALNVHAPYWHLLPLQLHYVFLHCLKKGTIFRKTLLNIQCVSWFSPKLLPENFLITDIIARAMIRNLYIVLLVKYPLFLYDFNGTWIFSTDFGKVLNIKFRDKPSSGGRVVSCRQTDRDGQTWRS